MATLVYVDLFDFKCFALLMCRGKFHDKAEILFNMGAGMIDTDEDMEISYNHPRLKRLFKTLIWLSEIFPKKYQNEFIDDIIARNHNPNKVAEAPKAHNKVVDAMDERRQKLLWSDAYLIKAEEDFDKIFNHVYHDHFVD